MAGEYKPDAAGMRALANSGEVSAAMRQVAEVGMRWAESVAPRDSGEYVSAFGVQAATLRGGRRDEPRAGAVLFNSANHAGVVEHRAGILARSVNIMEGYR